MKTPANKIPTRSLIDDLLRVANIVGKTPTFRQYAEYGSYHESSLVNHFGSFNTAKQQAFGTNTKPYRLSKKDIIDDIKSVKDRLGHVPSKSEYHLHGSFTESAILPKFLSWNKALMFIFGETYEDSHSQQTLACEECDSFCTKTPCQISQSKHHFCSQSCASSYAQKHKTHGTNKSKIEQFVKNKLESMFPDLDIKYNDRKEIGLELDILIPSKSIAFEINGIFHYKPIFGQKKLDKTKHYDQKKQNYCRLKNIVLHVIDITSMRNFNEKEALQFATTIESHIKGNFHADL